MSRYHHFQRIGDPGQFKRKLSREQAERIVELRDERGLSHSSIAQWFQRNGVSVDYRVVQRAYRWAKAA